MVRMSSLSPTSEPVLHPDLIQGSGGLGSPPAFSFTPIGPAPPTRFLPPTVRPTVGPPAGTGGHFHIQAVALSPGFSAHAPCFSAPFPPISDVRPGKRVADSITDFVPDSRCQGPQRKLHVTEDFVAQTMADLYISNPKPKVARRDLSRDVAEAMNLSQLASLEDLEDRFSNQAAITSEELNFPPQRSRKVPTRNRIPQLKLSLHQELKNVRPANNLIPESVLARYRPTPRQGSTAVVLWRPPGGIIPDVISSTWKGRGRTRCYSEVTSTPYSSHENLVDSDMRDLWNSSPHEEENNRSPLSAEAPELSSHSSDEEPAPPTLQRRNSAPEIGEPLPFLDDGSMEL